MRVRVRVIGCGVGRRVGLGLGGKLIGEGCPYECSGLY